MANVIKFTVDFSIFISGVLIDEYKERVKKGVKDKII